MMDPEQSLRDAENAIMDDDLEGAEILMESYWGWRDKGGFEPTIDGVKGDEFYSQLSLRYMRECYKYRLDY